MQRSGQCITAALGVPSCERCTIGTQAELQTCFGLFSSIERSSQAAHLANRRKSPAIPPTTGSLSNAGAEVLRRLYGEAGHAITLSNPSVPNIVLHYGLFQQITDDISDARVYGGIHFRTDQVAATHLGRAVGRAVYKNNLLVVHRRDRDGD